MAARWTRIESMEPSRVGPGSGARARARDAALARARRPQPADAVRLRFRAPEKRRGRPGAGRRGRRDGASLTLGALTTLAAAEMFMMAAILTECFVTTWACVWVRRMGRAGARDRAKAVREPTTKGRSQIACERSAERVEIRGARSIFCQNRDAVTKIGNGGRTRGCSGTKPPSAVTRSA